jgi:hypothetical protein
MEETKMSGKLATNDTSPSNLLQTLPGWDSIPRKDQIYIERETKGLGEALTDYGRSRLSIGEHLTNIKDKLPKGMFTKYLGAYHFKRSTAYKAIASYKNAVQWLPEPVLKAAMARNMPLLGESDEKPLGAYTNAIKRIPPPKSEDPVVIDQYLDSIEESRKRGDARSSKMAEVDEDAEVLLQHAYRFVSSRLKKIPNRGKSRRQWVDKLVGMILTELGVSGQQSFHPEGIPEEFVAKVGRPRLSDEEAA